MKIEADRIDGIYEITPARFQDHRGVFSRRFDASHFADYGLVSNWVQENISFSKSIGTVRGLHFQFPPSAETKLVTCISGAVFDVFVDLRLNSPSFAQWGYRVLDSEKMNTLYISKGFAHGFASLADNSTVIYLVDNEYSPESESGLLWNDPDLGITWPVTEPIISVKDSQNITIKQFVTQHKGICL